MSKTPTNQVSRRTMLRGAAAAGLAATTFAASTARAADKQQPAQGAVKGNINQSIVNWCFANHWNTEEICKIANQLGCKSIELIGPEHWDTLKKHDLTCALAGSHLFVQGMNSPRYQEGCIAKIKESIDHCAAAGFPTVITFTGFSYETGDFADGGIPDLAKFDPAKQKQIDPEEGMKNCVEGFKKVVGYAEKKKVNLSLEMLNSRVGVEMKGHPGYQGDHTDYCMEIIRRVGSPRFGLLFDIYHVQIMDGDIITRIKECGEAINHVHTAGNPGRCELDNNQEINYQPCMKALVEIGYQGYVGQEFIPTRDPLAGLREAVQLCDV